MRRLIVALLAGTVLVLPLAAATYAQAAQHRPRTADSAVADSPVYVCDGDGSGSCMSLPVNGTAAPGSPLYAVGESAGAWRWNDVVWAHVGDPGFTFSDPYIENALLHQPVYLFQLYAKPTLCSANSGGGDFANTCTALPDQMWVFDPVNHYLVNMGRSNDKDNWEVLCNPGSSSQLVIGTRDSCSTYHEQWNFS